MRQDVFRAPSVFNFSPPTVRVPGEAGVLGPQFTIFFSLTSFRRDNFVNRVIFATIPANPPNSPVGTSASFDTAFLACERFGLLQALAQVEDYKALMCL